MKFACCNQEKQYPTKSELVLGTCLECRKNSHKSCPKCHNYTLPPGSSNQDDCLFCSNPGSEQYHTGWLARNGKQLTTADSIKPAKKNYGNECPCGLHPSQCDYHKA